MLVDFAYFMDLSRGARTHKQPVKSNQSFPESQQSGVPMPFPIKTCIVCEEEFELKPDKPGYANRCPECSSPESSSGDGKTKMDADERKTISEANEARRQAMKNLLYRKDS